MSRKFIYDSVKDWSTLSTMSFGEWLRRRRLDAGISLRDLAERTHGACTYSYINQLENGRGGKKGLYQPDIAIVDALAIALGANKNEARLAAGYAGGKPEPPKTLPELIKALEDLGVPVPMPFGGFEMDKDGEGFKEALDRIYLDLQMVMNRVAQGRERTTYEYKTGNIFIDELEQGEDEEQIRKTG